MESVTSVPFPYDAVTMPAIPNDLLGTWVESSFNSYNMDGTVAHMQQQLNIAIDFMNDRKVPLFCGEFGAYIPNSNNDQRINWYREVRDYLESNGIAWTIWDYKGGFGLFEPNSSEFFNHDLNIPLVQALALETPPQSEYIRQPDSVMFNLYLDYTGKYINNDSYLQQGVLNFYNVNNPYDGLFSIYWTGASQYNYIGFNFDPLKDLTYLVDNGYAVDFWVKGNVDTTEFDLRFLDTKTSDINDHPWRMFKTINASVVSFNGQWQHVQIPLSDFNEHGSWDGEWFPPQGDFDWKEVEFFQIVAEHGDMTRIDLWFDNLRILDPAMPASLNISDQHPAKFELFQNYPNPFNSETVISYNLRQKNFVSIRIYDISGREILTLVDRIQKPGNHKITFNANDFASGIYFYQLTADNVISDTKKFLLIK